MKQKFFELSLKLSLLGFVIIIAAGLWYYTLGRKPKLVLSTPIAAKGGAPATHLVGPGEVLLLVGGKATLFDTAAGKEKWSSVLEAARPTPAPVQTPTPKPAPTPAQAVLVKNDKHDPMVQLLQSRVDRHTAKLEKWAAELNAKRAGLDTPLKVAAFKEEEAKYQAAVAEVRNEAEALRKSGAAARGGELPTVAPDIAPRDEDYLDSSRPEVFAQGPVICIVQARTLRLLDRANGRLTKEVPLPAGHSKIMPGAGCLYVLAARAEGGTQATRISTADGSVKAINTAGGVSASSFASSDRRGANVEAQRTAFSANGTELVQLDVRLLEAKITERQALKTDSASDWEAADNKTSGGWGSDAAVIAQTMQNDAVREVTGGKEYVDESTYEIVLRRPFGEGTADSAPIKVQGRPEVFSTASYDLVAAGRTLLAFDRANKKVWESTLGFPIAARVYVEDFGTEGAGTMSQPCLEDEKRVYVFDRGFLTAFDRNTGATAWRLPSVGIRKMQLDQAGSFDRSAVLYVTSANAAAETLTYSQEAAGGGPPLIFKLDANSGKILWKAEKFGECFASGGSVYASLETRNALDAVNSVFQSSKAITARFKLYKLSARDGRPQWEWFQTRRPLQIDADSKKVSLLFEDELQVVSSIAL